ncbi:MAG: SDR family NAD(P)-dependent oxidoreductase [Hyphomonas sp.]|uniref:SDR family NAD(P)-dependent oxidoreductase n=1 Tax=Hyphomonas sp. TaxID=87 RepID=UPI0035278470
MTVQPSLLFVAGLGYSALQLARAWPGPVAGTVRSAAKAGALRAEGIDAHVWDGKAPLELPEVGTVLVTIPPNEAGCPVFSATEVLPPGVTAVTYLSTTGVYGDLKGGWAFEDSALAPASGRARARVLAETQWRERAGGRLSIVRLPGIYGPGRSPFDRLRDGTAQRVVKPGQVFSRVHVEDIASGLGALMHRPGASGVFHLCDDEPAPPQDVTAYAATLLGLDPPPEVAIGEAGLSPMAASFYAECKRVSNARAKAALGWRPKYRTYREGLTAILAAERAAGT